MNKVETNITNFKNRQISVIGLGRSGFAIAQLANYVGAKVVISDEFSSKSIEENLKSLQLLGIDGNCGGYSNKIFESELIVISPGVASDSQVLLEAQKHEIKIIGEVEFASLFTDSPIVAVTGSNGKSTTVTVLAQMCQSDEIHGILAGNVGVAFSSKVLEELQNPDKNRVYILEISSFQMEFIESFHPYISIFLNISADHLDRHKTFNNYLSAKLRLSENQIISDFIIYNSDDAILVKTLALSNAQQITFSPNKTEKNIYHIENLNVLNKEYATLTKLENIGLPGRHNLYNLLAAASGAHCLGISDDKITDVIQSFKGIPHRLEKITNINGVEYINDSKATNIDAVKVAIESFEKPIILILGGQAKGNDFSELIQFKSKIKSIIVYGDAQTIIVEELSKEFELEAIQTLKDAVEISHNIAEKGDIILLSPGCASFDQFENFEERGTKFSQWVRNLK